MLNPLAIYRAETDANAVQLAYSLATLSDSEEFGEEMQSLLFAVAAGTGSPGAPLNAEACCFSLVTPLFPHSFFRQPTKHFCTNTKRPWCGSRSRL